MKDSKTIMATTTNTITASVSHADLALVRPVRRGSVWSSRSDTGRSVGENPPGIIVYLLF